MLQGAKGKPGGLIPMKLEKKSKVRVVQPAELNGFLSAEKPIVIDVRAGSELMQGYIKDSQVLPLSQLLQKLPVTSAEDETTNDQVKEKSAQLAYDKQSKILLVCQNGSRSVIAADFMLRNKFTNIAVLSGGIHALKDLSYPLAYPDSYYYYNQLK